MSNAKKPEKKSYRDRWTEKGYAKGVEAGRAEGKEDAQFRGQEEGMVSARRQVVFEILGFWGDPFATFGDVCVAKGKYRRRCKAEGMREILEVIGVSPVLSRSIANEMDPDTVKKLVQLALGLNDEFLKEAHDYARKAEDKLVALAKATAANTNVVEPEPLVLSLYERATAGSGRLIDAIKAVRARTGCGLGVAKKAVDDFVAGGVETGADKAAVG